MKCIGLVRSRVNRRSIRYEVKTVLCKLKANPNVKPIRYEMKTVSCKRGLSGHIKGVNDI